MNYSGGKNQPATAEYVYKEIRKRILLLKLEPGQKISENQMCEEYGVSRSVIRTVFTRLSQLQLLDVYPQRGTYVSLIDLDFIGDLLVLRTAVEKEVLYEIFQQIDKSGRNQLVKTLEKNVKEQECFQSCDTYDLGFQKLDSAFHKTMIDSVERFRLVQLLDDQMIHISRWRNFDVAFDHRTSQLIAEHRAIMEAIKEDNLTKAQQAMTDHLETISGIGSRAKAKYPQYFS